MLKINLSNEENGSLEASETVADTEVQESTGTLTDTPEESAEKAPKEKKPRRKITSREIVLIVLLCVSALVYYQKDTIFGLFSGGEDLPPLTEAPAPQPMPEPEPEPEPPAPDPTLVALGGIHDIVPARTWLTGADILYDGTYEIKGMAFTHDSALQLISALGNIGAVGTHEIPNRQKSSEAKYPFTVTGKMNDVIVPEILDNIPPERLMPLAESASALAESAGVKFLRLPQQGQVYTDDDLPFAIEGSYDGLQKIIAALCPDGGDTRIFRLKINAARPGKGYNIIHASFSLKTMSSI